MDEETRKRIEFSKQLLKTTPPEEISRINQLEHQRTCESYEKFTKEFERGYCYLCESPLKTFSKTKPCAHWLLRPKGFKKKDFALLNKKYGYYQMESYLRWVANFHHPQKNINDLSMEKSHSKIIETTIKYKHIEWSFSCTTSDKDGHAESRASNFPHFHFQMKMDGRSFIKFNDFHIPFTKEDIWKLELLSDPEATFEHRFMFGEGMEDVFDKVPLERILEDTELTENEEEASFHFSTIVQANDGETISGDLIADLFEESKRTGTPMASLLQKLNANVTTAVSPGPGVPDLAKRSGRGKNNKKHITLIRPPAVKNKKVH